MTEFRGSRAPWALLLGAMTGGLLVALWYALDFATAYPVEGGNFSPAWRDVIVWGAVSFIAATLIYALGLVVIGIPGWAILHRSSHRGPAAAVAWGGIATFAVVALWDLHMRQPIVIEPGDAMLTQNGAVVGWVIQRIAYSSKPPPARPS